MSGTITSSFETRKDKARTDRRVTRTRRLLHAALVELILEKGYSSLTVNEIANRADISRSTFYLHYKTKDDLLLDSIDQVINDLADQVAELPIKGYQESASDTMKTPIEFIFEEAARNARLFQVVLRSEWVSVNKLRDLIAEAFEEFLTRRLKQNQTVTGVPFNAIGHYFAGALLGFLTWWLDNNMPLTPPEMARKFQNLFVNGTKGFINYFE
jgi:AcrR family transcriptional regulator